MKIALKREFVLSILKKDVDDPQEGYILDRMTDIQLYDYFEGAGYIANPDECVGIVKIIAQDCIDGKTVYEEIGFPLDLEFYLQDPEE